MSSVEPANAPEWQQFLRLGEKILAQPTAAAQCALIEETIRQTLGGNARLWLAEPFYPLPGEPDINLLPAENAPPFVDRAFSTRAVVFNSPNEPSGNQPEDQDVRAIALPLVTHEILLGVLYVDRPDGPAFTPKERAFLEGLSAHAAVYLEIARQVAIKKWRSDQLALVRQVSAEIANEVDLDVLCQRVTELIRRTFHYYYVGIFTLDEGDGRLHFRANAGADSVQLLPSDYKVCVGEGLVGHAAASGEEIVSPDVRVEPRYRYVEVLPETRSEIALPLKVKNQVLGVLDVQSDEPDAFHENDIIVLRALADNIALAVEGARLYSNLRERAEQVSAVFEVSSLLTSILDLDELLDEVVSVIQKRFGYPYVHIYTVHAGRRKVFYVAGSGARSQAFEEHEVNYDLEDEHGIIPWVARTGKSLLANDVSKEQLFRPTDLPPLETRAELAIPLAFGGEILGVLDLQSDQVNAFDENDRFLLEALAGTISVAVRNAILYRSEQWRRQVADSFRDVAGLVSANVAISDLLDTILNELEKNLPCDASAIWLVDDLKEEEPTLKLAAVRGLSAERIIAALNSDEEVRGWLRRAVKTTQPIIRQPTDPFGPLGKALDFPPEYSSIAAPMLSGDRILGVITLAHSTEKRYGDEAYAMTSTFASYAAVAIQNARLYTSAQEQAWISTVLLHVAQASQSVNSISELFETMTRLIPLLVGVEKCAFYLREESLESFKLHSCYGFDLQSDERLFSDEIPAFARLLTDNQAVFIDDPVAELNLPAADVSHDRGTLVLVPLTARGQLLGAFLVAHEVLEPAADKAFDEQNLAILQGIAHQIAVAVENIRLLESRQEEAYVTAVLLQVAQAVVSQNELTDVLETVVHLMQILVGIDTSVVYLWDPVNEYFYMAETLVESSHSPPDPQQTYALGEYPLLDMVYTNDSMAACLLDDPNLPVTRWNELECMSPDERIDIMQPGDKHWVFGFPLSVKGEVFGAILVKETHSSPAMRDRRVEIINGIAQQISLAIQNDRLREEMVERERLEREMQLARQIQKTFLPDHLPEVPGWRLDVRWQTARQVGGDFYDVFRLKDGSIALVIADVADKGLPAALYMTVTRTLVRALSQNKHTPAQLLNRVNQLLSSESSDSMFVTAVYALLKPETGELFYANAGHNRPLIIRSKTGQIEQLPLGGMALGIQSDTRFKDHSFMIEPGDSIILFTDGLTESFSPNGEIFGDDRLTHLIRRAMEQNSRRLIESIEANLQEFRQGTQPTDDLTILIAERQPE